MPLHHRFCRTHQRKTQHFSDLLHQKIPILLRPMASPPEHESIFYEKVQNLVLKNDINKIMQLLWSNTSINFRNLVQVVLTIRCNHFQSGNLTKYYINIACYR